MALWMIFAGLTVVALLLVMYPLLRPAAIKLDDQGAETAVYRDQLDELERDAERGLISKKEKESALNEVSRRLLGAKARDDNAEHAKTARTTSASIIAVVSALAVTGFAGLLYKSIGRPDLPDQPQEQRIADAAKSGDMDAMLLQVKRVLDKNPKDIRGWRVYAPALKRVGRYEEAAEAYSKIMQLERPTPPLLVDFAESLLLANKGTPTDQVKKALETALAMDKTYAKGRFYWALTLQQEGKREAALKEWRLLLAQNPKNLQLQMAVQRQIAAITAKDGPQNDQQQAAKMPALDKSQREAAANMTAKERQEMIRSMVQRLADRLAENGNDLGGWQRLIRARMMLGEKEKAAKALKSAQAAFAGNSQALAQLEKFSAALGLE